MKQTLTPLRRATGLLLAAAALPFTPLLAQESQSTVQSPIVTPPPIEVVPAPVDTSPPATTTTQPTTTTTTTTVQPPLPAETAAEAASRTGAASPSPATVRPRTPAPARATRPASSAPARTTVVAPVPAPAAEAPAAVAELPAPAPETVPAEPVPVDVAVPVEANEGGGAIWPWLLAGALLIAAVALFALRRRRPEAERYEEVVAAPVAMEEPVAASEPEPAFAAAPIAATEAGRPWIDLQMRPVRAGVTGEDAVVEFELTVDNKGSAPARDVRISTFMLAAGSPQESEMEQALIDRPADTGLPEVDVDAGQAKRVEASVALSTAELDDSVLPVVVADARYTLPDGSEGRTSASFAVGVAIDDELAHFDVEHPSGLHDDVEARLRGEPQKV